MSWTLNGTRFYVQEINGDASQIIPRLQPLSGPTILQIFGYESEVNSINALVVGSGDMTALMQLRKTGNTYELMSPEGSLGNFYVKKSTFRRIPNYCQTIRPDLPSDCEVYNMDFELFPESD